MLGPGPGLLFVVLGKWAAATPETEKPSGEREGGRRRSLAVGIFQGAILARRRRSGGMPPAHLGLGTPKKGPFPRPM